MAPFSEILFALTPFIGSLGGSYILTRKVKAGKKTLAKKGIVIKSKSWGKVREELKKNDLI
jgi:hypothetical protein